MIRDDEGHLMFIEPTDHAKPGVDDRLTQMARDLLQAADTGKVRYKGFHVCACGEISSNLDHKLFCYDDPHAYVLTNSLLVHYVSCHRDECPPAELEKLERVHKLMFG